MRELRLQPEDKAYLEQYTKRGQGNARSFKRATMLLLLDKGETGLRIAEQLNVDSDTVYIIKRRYIEEGLERALNDKQRPGRPLKYAKKEEAEIIAYACTVPPEGSKRWSVRSLTEALRKRKGFKTINRETIRLILKRTIQNLGRKRCGVSSS